MRWFWISLVMVLLVGCGLGKEKEKFQMTDEGINFLLSTNSEPLDTVSTLAQVLCIEDLKQDESVEERERVASECLDSVATEDEYYIVDDGEWHKYQKQAYDMIVVWCVDSPYDSCKWFK